MVRAKIISETKSGDAEEKLNDWLADAQLPENGFQIHSITQCHFAGPDSPIYVYTILYAEKTSVVGVNLVRPPSR